MLTSVDKNLLREIADIDTLPQGAYNIRKNGQGIERHVTENIDIVTKTDKPGIDIIIKPYTKNENVHVPVILSEGLEETVYNTFEIGEYADVEIVAGCGIHNESDHNAKHDGIHEFFCPQRRKNEVCRKALRRRQRKRQAHHEPENRY